MEAGREPPARGWTGHGLNSGLIFDWTCRGVGFLPRGVSYWIGKVGTWLAWRFMPKTRKAVALNLRAVFPSASQAALEQRALLTFRAYARDVIDFLRAVRAPEEDTNLFDVEPEDIARFKDLIALGRGMILLSGHYGNWEIGSVIITRVFGHRLTIMAMAEASEQANRQRREIRDALGVDTIDVRKSLDTALQIRRQLADNRILAMLMDRRLGRDQIGVSFLGRPAWFLMTPALMGYMTGAPLLPTFIERLGPARYTVIVGEPIFVSRDLPRDESVRRASQQFADLLSERIRNHPEYWYSFYRYWDEQDQDRGSG